METALLTRQMFLKFSSPVLPVFLGWSRGWGDQWTSEHAGHFFCWCTTAPILSLHSRVLSAVVACSVWWLCPRTLLSHSDGVVVNLLQAQCSPTCCCSAQSCCRQFTVRNVLGPPRRGESGDFPTDFPFFLHCSCVSAVVFSPSCCV